ncbi:MAG: retroviral-like aspartic protease family protein [Flavobacteriaceae bacterium]|nr:retroviral-like aspartic protease family protein [Flavobacteriaceae bacterium]
MYKPKLIFILIFLVISSYSQQDIVKCDTKKIYANAEYTGCLDVENKRDGYGIMIFNNGVTFEGNFKKDVKEGKGKITFIDGSFYNGEWINDKREGLGVFMKPNGDAYEGYFKNNMRNGVGKNSFSNLDKKTTQNGVFKNNEFFSGESLTVFLDDKTTLSSVYKNGSLISKVQVSSDFSIEYEGSFYPNGTLETGKETNISQNGNLIIIRYFEDGDEIPDLEYSNVKNYYVEDDIDGDLERVIINLETEPNDDSKFINLKFNTINHLGSFRFIFDTGAESFSIGYNLFKKLKENGLEYEDMNVTLKSVGVLGVPMDNKVIKIKQLTIGEYVVKNVIAHVETVNTANYSLLGIGFMKKFKNVYWSLNDDIVIFEKK